MDWKNIKTIFIFTFLILNLYLGTEFNNKVNPDLDVLNPETQEKLEDIQYSGKLPKIENKKISMISSTSKKFTEEDIDEFLNKNSNQELTIESEEENVMSAKLKKPYSINAESGDLTSQLEHFVDANIPDAEDYVYWKHDQERNIFVFRQQLDRVPFYFSENVAGNNLTGLIELIPDDSGNIASYRLTKMDVNKQEKVEKGLKAEEAVLLPGIGTTLEKIELVYFTGIHNEGWKVFVPSWHIITENGEWMVDVTNSTEVTKLDEKTESEVD
ncbi:two-component system regulatory protein YycI [Pseudalkalibacillus berkeleyi]|uniref:Two-component system regulatory protein YycI n=1 Tax=Pseudalkalibacillus berkeleyi TaxID=1069813 RepID=A0ABS9H4U6_9BACL|nr:two-component system regulatory protein YycI [Pseudalkalibacillus berkeleyi]MCF6139091.1 two-component system regulatory protein YycI [Pseudalkalibacillus berkeleyi]